MATVQKRNGYQGNHGQRRKQNASHQLRPALEQFERLKKKKEIPFWPGCISGVGWIGHAFKRQIKKGGRQKQESKGYKHCNRVTKHLFGIESLFRLGIVTWGRSDTVLPDQHDMENREERCSCRKNNGVQGIEPGKRDRSDPVSSTQYVLQIRAQ